MSHNWEDAPDWAQWWAQDEDGSCAWFEFEPEPDQEYWRPRGGKHDEDGWLTPDPYRDGWLSTLEKRGGETKAYVRTDCERSMLVFAETSSHAKSMLHCAFDDADYGHITVARVPGLDGIYDESKLVDAE